MSKVRWAVLSIAVLLATSTVAMADSFMFSFSFGRPICTYAEVVYVPPVVYDPPVVIYEPIYSPAPVVIYDYPVRHIYPVRSYHYPAPVYATHRTIHRYPVYRDRYHYGQHRPFGFNDHRSPGNHAFSPHRNGYNQRGPSVLGRPNRGPSSQGHPQRGPQGHSGHRGGR